MSEHTPGPWEYVASTEHHGPYVCGPYGGDICDCYTMTHPRAASRRNGGISEPVHFQHEHADANALLIAAAPDMLVLLKTMTEASEYQPIAAWFGAIHAAIRKATVTPTNKSET